MSHELHYTSAPRGLQPGSRGFCTVAMTSGLSAALVEKLESLSGYRHLYPPSDPKASLNPVAHSHVRIQVAGKPYHVLSRICAAGLDYSERTNKFAHHVVLEPHELPPAGPAWLLMQPGFMESSWDGEVRISPAGRTPPAGDVQPTICRAWQELTGDAGWAGVVVESFLSDPNRPVYLLFEPGVELLPLLAEALALLPAKQRWDVTFTTYFTALPQGVQISWRGALGSPDAKTAAKSATTLVVDLSRPIGDAKGGPLVEQARTGQAAAEPLPKEGADDWLDEDVSLKEIDDAPPRQLGSIGGHPKRRQHASWPIGRPVAASESEIPQRLDLNPPMPPAPLLPRRDAPEPRQKRSGWWRGFGVGVAAGMGITGVCLTLALWVRMITIGEAADLARTTGSAKIEDEQGTAGLPLPENGNGRRNQFASAESGSGSRKLEQKQELSNPKGISGKSDSQTQAKTGSDSPKAEQHPKKPDDAPPHNKAPDKPAPLQCFDLPDEKAINEGKAHHFQPVAELPANYSANNRESWSLVGRTVLSESDLKKDQQLKDYRLVNSHDRSRKLLIKRALKDSQNNAHGKPIAEFDCQGRKILFKWSEESTADDAPWRELVRDSALELQSPDKIAVSYYALRKPLEKTAGELKQSPGDKGGAHEKNLAYETEILSSRLNQGDLNMVRRCDLFCHSMTVLVDKKPHTASLKAPAGGEFRIEQGLPQGLSKQWNATSLSAQPRLSAENLTLRLNLTVGRNAPPKDPKDWEKAPAPILALKSLILCRKIENTDLIADVVKIGANVQIPSAANGQKTTKPITSIGVETQK